MLCWQSSVGSKGLGGEHSMPVVVIVVVVNVSVSVVVDVVLEVVCEVVEVHVMVSPG